MTLARATISARPRRAERRARRAGTVDGRAFDPFASSVIADPPAAYRRLHAYDGVHRVRRDGSYVLAGYDQVHDAARASEVLSSGKAGVTLIPAALPMLLTSDRPRHSELRRLVAPHFTREATHASEPLMKRVVSDAVDRMLARPVSDAVAELAVPLPITVIASLLGVPTDDMDEFHRRSDGVIEGFHAARSPLFLYRAARVAHHVVMLHRYMRRRFERLRDAPGEDLISALVASRESGTLDEQELFWFALMLLVAGNETTTNLIGSMLVALASDPASYERLRAEPTLVDSVVEESLRWGSPIQGMFRSAIADYQVGDETIPAGGRVLLLFAAANRDPGKYHEPDRFVIDRNPTDHLAFGNGIHFCLGAHLARAETAVVLRELIDRVARLELAGPVTWTRNPTVRGPKRLPLRMHAA